MVTMKVVFIFSACVILLVNGLNPDLDDEWESFMKNYNKAYENDEEAQVPILTNNLSNLIQAPNFILVA